MTHGWTPQRMGLRQVGMLLVLSKVQEMDLTRLYETLKRHGFEGHSGATQTSAVALAKLGLVTSRYERRPDSRVRLFAITDKGREAMRGAILPLAKLTRAVG